MFRAVGKEVLYLKRLSMGSLTLDPALEAGAWRRLTADELAELRKSL
jgi:16S rRNA pseudouridine516 synthase